MTALTSEEILSAWRLGVAEDAEKIGSPAATFLHIQQYKDLLLSCAKEIRDMQAIIDANGELRGEIVRLQQQLAATGWQKIPDSLPPLDVPVWLRGQRGDGSTWCKTGARHEPYVESGCLWAVVYEPYWHDGRWRDAGSELDDLHPTHFMLLPTMGGESCATQSEIAWSQHETS